MNRGPQADSQKQVQEELLCTYLCKSVSHVATVNPYVRAGPGVTIAVVVTVVTMALPVMVMVMVRQSSV